MLKGVDVLLLMSSIESDKTFDYYSIRVTIRTTDRTSFELCKKYDDDHIQKILHETVKKKFFKLLSDSSCLTNSKRKYFGNIINSTVRPILVYGISMCKSGKVKIENGTEKKKEKRTERSKVLNHSKCETDF